MKHIKYKTCRNCFIDEIIINKVGMEVIKEKCLYLKHQVSETDNVLQFLHCNKIIAFRSFTAHTDQEI